MKTPEQKKQALMKLLMSLFSAEEFRRFVRYLENGDFLESQLPTGNPSTFALFSEGTKILYENQAITDDFFHKLISERPRRSEIKELQKLWKT